MARNLVKEKEAQEAQAQEHKEEAPVTAPAPSEPVRVITFEQLIASNLEALMQQVNDLHKSVLEGFKQVGVTFQPEK